MNFTWVTLTVVLISAIVKLLVYLLGDKRRRRLLEEEIEKTYEQYAKALARNDTVRLTALHHQLNKLRSKLKNIKNG